jgi:cyclophilin family peptidyl-prolyl cis-trans isomerase/Tfp pilus assembly protein PilN
MAMLHQQQEQYQQDEHSSSGSDENVALLIDEGGGGYEWDHSQHGQHDPSGGGGQNDEQSEGWAANPQSPTEDLPTPNPAIATARRTTRRNNNVAAYSTSHQRRNVQKAQVPVLLLGLALVGLAAVFLSRTSVNYTAKQVSILAANRNHLDEKLKKAERDLSILKREISAMDAMIHKQQAIDAHSTASEASHQLAMNEMNALQNRLHSLSEQGADLKHHVQSMSLQGMTSKYGDNTVKKLVEIELVFPPDANKAAAVDAGPTKFVIELEGELMPHSTFTFLEMVSTGLLDGCSFILNALHVLKAAPLPYDGTSAAVKAKAFTAHGLESVAFKEYNDAFPHKRYTVGFAADGSPSFYINTEDNTEIHVGDPCFGRIIQGFDTVKRLEESPTRNGIWYAKRIGIKHARILNWSPPPPATRSTQ